MKMTMAKRIESVELTLAKAAESPATLDVGRLLAQTKLLMETRNHIAHGTLAMGNGEGFEMVRYNKREDRMVFLKEDELIKATRDARQLSNDFSLLLVLAQTNAEFTRPYAPGECRKREGKILSDVPPCTAPPANDLSKPPPITSGPLPSRRIEN